MKFRIPARYIPFTAIALCALASCRSHTAPDERDMLVKVGSATLTRQDLQKAMPFGLKPEDSTKFAKAFISGWIENEIIDDLAQSNIHDTREIDEMVADYRRQLIMREYRRRMFEQNDNTAPSADEIKAYYDAHKNEMRTTEPLLKGVYIKVADSTPHLTDMRKWYRSEKADDIDRLDKTCADNAVNYDYFRDRWVEWSAIETRIPYDFGQNPDQFLHTHTYVDTSNGGMTYLLAVSGYLPSGSVKPLEIAEPEIKERLMAAHRMDYDRRLIKELYDNGVKSGEIVVY